MTPDTEESTPPSPPRTDARRAGRRVMVLTHTGRDQAVAATEALVHGLTEAGLEVLMPLREAADIPRVSRLVTLVADPEQGLADTELVIVVGGDGTILRAAQLSHGSSATLLGINLGHIGFLAESEREDLAEVVRRVATGEYAIEERLTLDVRVFYDGKTVEQTFAVNEATVEKGARHRMIEVAVEIDARPVSTFSTDGVCMATPTGSTAYAFSAGGPLVWPQVEALLLVPICAHALFARPMVVSPNSVLAVEVLAGSPPAVVVCDGRRSFTVPPGARVEVTRGTHPLRLARLVAAPFTDRLVAKLGLPVTGWRGPRGQ